MESITIRVENQFAKEIDDAMNPDYSTKTEFIREAIRDKIKKVREEKALDELLKHFEKAKSKTSYEEERKIREEAGKKIAERFNLD